METLKYSNSGGADGGDDYSPSIQRKNFFFSFVIIISFRGKKKNYGGELLIYSDGIFIIVGNQGLMESIHFLGYGFIRYV